MENDSASKGNLKTGLKKRVARPKPHACLVFGNWKIFVLEFFIKGMIAGIAYIKSEISIKKVIKSKKFLTAYMILSLTSCCFFMVLNRLRK
jgi:hypothetical protein